MSVMNMGELAQHIGHDIVIVSYGEPVEEVCIECETCNEVLISLRDGDE
jgi:hypothetical protein